MTDADKMIDVTPRTVAFHKYRMMEQLQLKTNADLIQFAIREGMVPMARGH